MRIAIGQFFEPSDEILRFGAQLGVSGVVVNGAAGRLFSSGIELGGAEVPYLNVERSSPDGKVTSDRAQRWEFPDLLQLRTRCEAYGLRLEALEDFPHHFYDRAMLGLPGRDEQIENVVETIRNLGRAGISVFGFHWMATGVWRTSTSAIGRGGSRVTSFDLGPADRAPLSHGRVYSDEEMWSNYEYFIRAVLPAAEEAGVTLALHPDDPPVESLGGVARIFRSTEALRRGIEICPSPNLGILFCVGSWASMGPRTLEALLSFAREQKIVYVHLRNVRGSVPTFRESFPDEGDVDVSAVVFALRESGFDGFIIDDHVPFLEGDSGWAFRSRAYCTGYVAGLVAASSHDGSPTISSRA